MSGQRPLVAPRSVGYLQDLPPVGGFPRITAHRGFPFRGPSSALLLGVGTAAIVVGCYGTAKSNTIRHDFSSLIRQANRDILAPLQAETDLSYLKEQKEFKEWAKEVMKEKPDWDPDCVTSVYKTKNFVRPREPTWK